MNQWPSEWYESESEREERLATLASAWTIADTDTSGDEFAGWAMADDEWQAMRLV